MPVSLGEREEPGDGQAKDDEGESVDRGLLEDEGGRDREGGRISEAVEEDCAEQRRGPERASGDQIQDEEPDRDRGRSGQPDQNSLVKHFLSIHGYLLGTLRPRSGRVELSFCHGRRRLR